MRLELTFLTMARLYTIICSNSQATNYTISSGYGLLDGEEAVIELPLAPVPQDVKLMGGGGLIEGAEKYQEMHLELWKRTEEYLDSLYAI